MTTDKTHTPVVIYARYSTDRQDARSIDDQVRRCERYATEKGYTVTDIYKDAAESGATLNRDDMQRLLRDARRRGGAPFKAVLVDDLSRLSRDLGDTWNIVFGELLSADVRVIDANTGMASDGAGARLTFGAMALVNDAFLDNVRKQTHRGLEGRALAGFWTGGRVYGYSTVPEENPQDPERPRARPIINVDEAEVVRRIFRLYADGQSTKAIAAKLNQEGLPAPYDGGHGAKKNGHGWPHSTVGKILHNERYTGHWVWNQYKWVRRSGQNRRRVARPAHEHVVREVPELVIIDRELWDAVQGRARRGPKNGKGRPHGAGKHCHVFSGLLRCGICGNSIGVTGQKTKNEIRYAQLGCTTNNSRGDAVCRNGASISEKKVVTGLLGAIQDLLTTPERIEKFTATVRKRLVQLQVKTTDGKLAALERQERDADRRVRNLTEGIAKGGWTESLAVKLKAEEARHATLKGQVAAAASQQKPEQPLPSDEVIRQQLWNLMKLVSTDPVRGREALARCLRPFVLTPEGEPGKKLYRATGALNLSLILKTPASNHLEAGVSDKTLCGGPRGELWKRRNVPLRRRAGWPWAWRWPSLSRAR
ncbi:MAG: recombinase family protein [Myxococcaceae bacterium]